MLKFPDVVAVTPEAILIEVGVETSPIIVTLPVM